MKKKKKIIVNTLFIIFLIIFIISTYNTIKWLIDSKKTNKKINEINEEEVVKKLKDSDKTVEIKNTSPYYEFLDMDMIDVDFTKLKKRNSDVVGWIQLPGTKINYPFVQTTDNTYYLTKSIDKKNNSAGWVFLDYRNNIKKLDQNTIIYAHGRLEKTMFGSLKDVLEKKWQKNKNNYVIKMATPDITTVWQIFSAYHIPTTSDYLYINFNDDNRFNSFNTKLINRSMYNFQTTVSTTDKIITLSTCYNKSEKMVVHAKLIKYEYK